MRVASLIFPIILGFSSAASAKPFRVIHNTVDPSVFGTKGGAALNASEEGAVKAFTFCMRYQDSVQRGFDLPFNINSIIHTQGLCLHLTVT